MPSDAFQPYSSIPTHLLLVHKTEPEENSLTWFLRPEFDGYREGRSRDLTQSPAEPNDLTFAEEIIDMVREDNQAGDDDLPIKVQEISRNESILGFLVRPTNDVVINHARLLPALDENPSLILVQIQQGKRKQEYSLPLANGEFSPKKIADAEKLIRKRLELTKKATIPQPDIFQNQGLSTEESLTPGQTIGEGLIFTSKGQLFGVAVSRRVIQEQYYALESDRYVQAPEVEVERRPPHQILRDIQENQNELSQRVYQLLGWISTELTPDISLPSPILKEKELDDEGKAISVSPFGTLSEEQKEVWKLVLDQTEEVNEEEKTGKYFTPQMLFEQSPEGITEECIDLTLDILAGMGLIIPVSQPNPIDSTAPPMSFYRIVEERDKWQFDISSEEGGN